eukprot:TRINITY_DN81379_c0_g1_i1.p1 TRINITY_DN81379_c0_g1~~TRINITY_DN81379_c0_g1_i1.p1  ORF type:complete len:218 (+),score=48.35 TRINITY_DN81379_c0_g1_i1:74-727(+)
MLLSLALSLALALVEPEAEANFAQEASVELASDDECPDGSECSLSALQVRAAEVEEGAQEHDMRDPSAGLAPGLTVYAEGLAPGENPAHFELIQDLSLEDVERRPAMQRCGSRMIDAKKHGCCAGLAYTYGELGCCGDVRHGRLYNVSTVGCCYHSTEPVIKRRILFYWNVGMRCCNYPQAHVCKLKKLDQDDCCPEEPEDWEPPSCRRRRYCWGGR